MLSTESHYRSFKKQANVAIKDAEHYLRDYRGNKAAARVLRLAKDVKAKIGTADMSKNEDDYLAALKLLQPFMWAAFDMWKHHFKHLRTIATKREK